MGWWELTHHVDFSRPCHFRVCGRCGALGRLPRSSDANSTCPGCSGDERGHPLEVELCRCCGEVLLKNQSKFSTWFCVTCVARVCALNHQLGRYAIPIGRHSIHGGLILRGDSSDVDVEIFAASWGHVAEAMKPVADWSREVRRRILRERFPERPRWIPIRRWDRRVVDPEHTESRFQEMLDFLTEASRQERAG
jgi:hypothetical protein